MIAVRPATPDDVATILRFVRDLATFEREPDSVEAIEDTLADALFGPRPAAEAVIAEAGGAPAGFALFFHNFSTWTGRRGVYLEDLYVTPEARGQGVGKALLRYLAAWRSTAAARGSNGRCSTGTWTRSPSTAASARSRWTSGPYSASPATRCTASPRAS